MQSPRKCCVARKKKPFALCGSSEEGLTLISFYYLRAARQPGNTDGEIPATVSDATPPTLMMDQKPAMYPQPYPSASPTTGLPGPFPGMVRQKQAFGPMPVQVPPPRGAFPTNIGMQQRQALNRPPTAPNQLRLQLQQRLQGQQQVSLEAGLSRFCFQVWANPQC